MVRLAITITAAAAFAVSTCSAQTPKVSFARDVAPLFAHKCLECHGTDPVMSKLDLRTRETALRGGQRGASIVPGDSAASLLFRHVTGEQTPRMPLGSRLTGAEIGTIKNWIDAGAEWDPGLKLTAAGKGFTNQQKRLWSLQPLTRPAPPAVKKTGWVRNPVDSFILAKLEAKSLSPNPAADKATLIRRASLDLIGLPPSPEEVQTFLSDSSPAAFAKVVDRLLESPHYGERWGRHWLDLARYADTNGFKTDEPRPNIWRYRDYVIQSFNEDKPYDRFVREQIAGDELYPDDLNARIGVAFNRHFTEETNQPVIELRRQEILNDITDTAAGVFLGLTYGCARCHDHKYDPILHKDYYRLQAFFANIREDDHLNLLTPPERATYHKRYQAWDEATREIRREMHSLVEPMQKARADFYTIRFSEGTRQALSTPANQRSPMQHLLAGKAMPQINYRDRDFVRQLKPEQRKRYEQLEASLKQFDSLKPAEAPEAQTIIDNSPTAPKTHVLAVGNWDTPREEVQPGFLSILDASNAKITPLAASTGRRTALAHWLADARNPLTARVMVNRIWHFHFGRGIVASVSDFGMMGDRPTHPELLDHLASAFIEGGWSVKKMHRLIMLSNTYQQSSAARAAAAADPANKLWWRWERHRAEGESIRDSMLFVSGKLNTKMGGPGIFPQLPPGAAPSRYGGWQEEKNPANAARRSVYVFVKRNMLYPMFDAFDAPNPAESCARRFRTVIPAQALILMNDALVLDWSRALASRVLNDAGLSEAQQVDRAYKLALSRAPNAGEREAVASFLKEQSAIHAARLSRQEQPPMPENVPAGMDPSRAAAFVDFCHALLNTNEFLYLN